MLNTTHTLVGLMVARTPLGRRVPQAALVGAIAANLPDLDIVSGVWGGDVYLDYHRGATHAIAGVVMLSPLLAWLVSRLSAWYVDRRGVPGRPAGFWTLLPLISVAVATHPLLDWTNSYGIRPFLPFSSRWYHGDLVFVVSPYIDGLLIASIVASWFAPKQRERLAAAGLAAVVAFWGLSAFLKGQALSVLEQGARAEEPIVSLAVFPGPLDLTRWVGIVETPTRIRRVLVSVGEGEAISSPLDIEKPPAQTLARLAEQSYAMRVFLDFSRFPICQEERRSAEVLATCFDLGFYRPDLPGGFAAQALFDETRRMQWSVFGFDRVFRPKDAQPTAAPAGMR